MVVKELQVMAHLRSIFLHQYLDDWVIHHHNRVTLLDHLRVLMDLGLKLGFIFNLQKSDLDPSKDFVFVGYRFRTDLGIVLPSSDREKKIRSVLGSCLRLPSVPASLVQSLLGLLSATEKLVPLGRLHLRETQFDLRSQWSQLVDPEDTPILLSHRAKEDLRWWLNPANMLPGAPMRPSPPSHHVFTDASMEGWGAHLNFMEVKGLWLPPFQSWHINNLELRAVLLALQHWVHQLRDQSVLIATDNSTVVSYINKQGGQGRCRCAGRRESCYFGATTRISRFELVTFQAN